MAASKEQIQQEFLSCPICYEIYQEPKCLPCLHTFCRHCIDSYIHSLRDFGVVRKKGFPCPMCKQFLFIKGWNKPLDEWAEEIKDNFLIQNMIDCLSKPKVLLPKTVSSFPIKTRVNHILPSAPPPEVDTPPPLPSAPPPEDEDSPLLEGDTPNPFRGYLHRANGHLAVPLGDTSASSLLSRSSEHLDQAEAAPPDFRFRANSASELNRNQPIVRFTPKASRWNLEYERYPFDSKVQYADICQLNDRYNSVAVADYNGGRIVFFRGLYDGTITKNRDVQVNGRPCSIALFDDGTDKKCLVVNLQHQNVLIFLSIPYLETICKLKTVRNYRCVTSLRPFTILAGSADRPAGIDLIELDNRYRVVYIKRLTLNVGLCSPSYLCALSNLSFVVSDNGKKCITYFCIEDLDDIFARKIFDIKSTRDPNFRCPGGLCFDKDTRMVYAVDHGRNSVFRFEPEVPVLCEPFLDEYNRVEKPASVCLGPKGSLVVADWKGRVTVYREKDDRR